MSESICKMMPKNSDFRRPSASIRKNEAIKVKKNFAMLYILLKNNALFESPGVATPIS